jgi:hypothetical protein
MLSFESSRTCQPEQANPGPAVEIASARRYLMSRASGVSVTTKSTLGPTRDDPLERRIRIGEIEGLVTTKPVRSARRSAAGVSIPIQPDTMSLHQRRLRPAASRVSVAGLLTARSAASKSARHLLFACRTSSASSFRAPCPTPPPLQAAGGASFRSRPAPAVFDLCAAAHQILHDRVRPPRSTSFTRDGSSVEEG